jgi:hypothetical protein
MSVTVYWAAAVGGIMRKHRVRCQSRPRRTPLDETPVTGEYCDDGAATFDAAKLRKAGRNAS